MYKINNKVWWGAGKELDDVNALFYISAMHPDTDDVVFPRHPSSGLLWIPMRDDCTVPIGRIQLLDNALKLIERDKLFPVFVYCRAGQERSMAIACAIFARLDGMPFIDAVAHVKSTHRPDGMRHVVFQESFKAAVEGWWAHG